MIDDNLKNETEAEFSFEENLEDRVPETGDSASKLKKVKADLKACQAERTEYLAGWQRAKADYVNLKKATDAVRSETLQWAKEGVLADLFGLADSFELAFSNEEAWAQAPTNWRQGVEYIYQQLQGIFRDHGVTEINPRPGDKFNHYEAESLGVLPAESEAEDDLVVAVLKKGYKLNERVVRPAVVKVKQWSKN